MPKKRGLKDVAKDPIAEKEKPAVHVPEEQHGVGHYALMIAIGLVAGVVGGMLSSRVLKLL